MSTYHKPKTYRSVEGCCICKAKSSSSRFTDSEKYASEFEQCFQPGEERSGDICNACVLIVKRFRQLPRGTTKNWAHVVDVRAGPGNTSKKVQVILKVDSKKRPLIDDTDHHKIRKKKKVEGTKCEAWKVRNVRKNKSTVRRRPSSTVTGSGSSPPTPSTSGFIDLGYWRRMESCCGLVYVGQLGEVMVDANSMTTCSRSSPAPPSSLSSMSSALPSPFLPQSSIGIGSEKCFGDEEDDIDSISFYSDSDSSLSKASRPDCTTGQTDDEGFEGMYDKAFTKRIKNSFSAI